MTKKEMFKKYETGELKAFELYFYNKGDFFGDNGSEIVLAKKKPTKKEAYQIYIELCNKRNAKPRFNAVAFLEAEDDLVLEFIRDDLIIVLDKEER